MNRCWSMHEIGNESAFIPRRTSAARADRRLRWTAALLACLSVQSNLPLAYGQSDRLPRATFVPASRAADTFRSSDGFRVELLAAEPLVQDPVVLKYDADGRAYVAEMYDYPYTDSKFDKAWSDQQSPPAGRIRIVTDEDGDGVFDRSVIFVDQISWPTGIAFWKGGVYVAATPDLWYFRDTDGDLRADERRRVFTGFRKYNVQAVMNNLQWGIDHCIYGAGGGNGGTITAPGRPHVAPVVLGRHDFRFDPRSEILEVLPGGARFGNTFDAWGERFICNIRNPLRHIALPADAVASHRSFPPRLAVVDAAPSGDALQVFRVSPPEAWRVINARRLAEQRHHYSPRSEMHATGFVTSASGVTVYRGGAYPDRYHGNVFVGEVAGNLVMRYRLEEDGLTFRAEHVLSEGRHEFLASTDNWHRPVNFANAPDGMLHLVDMYRETIEHPWSIPDDLKAKLDLLSGRDRGRIYRLVPKTFAPSYRPPPAPRLSRATTEELIGHLSSPHGWWRETAQRLLWERRDPAAPSQLKRLLRVARSAHTQFVLLWTLEGLDALDPEDVAAVSGSEDPRLRCHVVRLAGRHATSRPAFEAELLRARDDADVRVRFEAALGAKALPEDKRLEFLVSLTVTNSDREAIRAAIVGSAEGCELALLDKLLAIGRANRHIDAVISELLHTVARDRTGCWEAARRIARTRGASPDALGDEHVWEWCAILRQGIGRDLGRKVEPPFRIAKEWLERSIAAASDRAADPRAPVAIRVAALRMLALDASDSVGDLLLECLGPDQPLDVQLAALESLARQSNDLPETLLPDLEFRSTRLQQEIIILLLSRPDWTVELLQAVKAGRLRVESIPLRYRSSLRRSRDARVVQLAEAVLGAPVRTDRAAVIRKYEPALALDGNAASGAEVYRRECRSCHRLKGEGVAVGPDLDSVRHRSARELLTHILDPDREIAPEFQRFAVQTKSGRSYAGILREETPDSVTLVDADDRRIVIRRSEIEALRSDRHSLMPNGLEKKITLQQMADLLGFILESPQRRPAMPPVVPRR